MLKLLYLPLLVWFSVSETESFEEIGGDALETQVQREMQEQVSRDAQGISNGVQKGAWAEKALSRKRKLREDLEEYLKLQATVTPDDSPEFLDALSDRRNQLINSGIDPDYEKYRDKIDRIQGKIYAITQNINPKTGLFGVVPTEDVKDSRLGTLLTAEQIGYFNSLPKSMQDEFLFEGIVETFFPQGGMDKVTALGLLKEHYQTDSMNGVIIKYAQELQRNKEEETSYREASTRFFDSFIETGGDYQKAIDSLDGNLNLYAENIFNQEPELKYIYQRAYNSVSWIKDEYIESGELDWNKMADRLLKLGEGETFSLAIQMLPYMLPKDNRTWLMQVIDDTVEDVPRFLRLSFSNVGDKEIERLALNIQKSYRDRRDIPRSWLGKFGRTVMEQVSKITAVTVSALGSAAAFSGTGPGALIAGGVAATTVGSMVYGAPKGLETYRANLSGVGAVSYGITVFIGFGVAVVVGLIAIITLFLVVRLIRSIRRGWSFTRWACFLTVFLLGVAVVGGGYSFLWKNYLLPYGFTPCCAYLLLACPSG